MLHRRTRAGKVSRRKNIHGKWTIRKLAGICLIVSVFISGAIYFSSFYRKSVYADLAPLQRDYSQYNYKQ
ncbi:hypothetical protein A2363_03215 [Candidatus Gottesmanbacteria bacterium RIFOXYB1_FULL_47_11]|uniref:Uncharacterized protein n=1 Tax=Candidatus Gottesmanbacteria bacterium RIFOXYB1_FULL_47_11 TaxID=1798401 RepID=A0A1F6BCR1_9BACT|nr:MAG: hypothetical protein A2363_03215 [Candidatus Gottesmanbacteria bacterium RIFOXYB1_FULL_47_11]